MPLFIHFYVGKMNYLLLSFRIVLTWTILQMYINLSDCLRTVTVPGAFKNIVLGVNRTEVKLTWTIDLEGEILNQLKISRYKENDPAQRTRVGIMFSDNNASTSSPKYKFNASGLSSPAYAVLTIKDVLNQSKNEDGSEVNVLKDTYVFELEVDVRNSKVKTLVDIVKVQVFVPPDITYLNTSIYANQGESITLACNASGHPVPRVTWIHKNTNTVIAYSFVTSFNVTGKASEGKYCCHVTNRYGEATNCTSISVMEYQPINTTLESNVRFSTANGKFKVICKAKASPTAKYFIQQGNKTLRNNSFDGNVTVTTPVNEAYINLTCIAKNKYGEGKLSFLRIPIYEPPIILSQWENPVTTNITNSSFECKATGIPSPNIAWYNTAEDKVVGSDNGMLQVTNKDCKNITLKYYCMAANDAGNVTTNLTVRAICRKDKSETNGNGLPSGNKLIIIVIIVCILLLLFIGSISFFCILISRKRRPKDTQQPGSRGKNQLVDECPYGEPVDAVPSGMIASESNIDYATVQETGYRRVKNPVMNKTKPISEPVYAKVKKKKKRDISVDIPLNPVYDEIPSNTPKVTSQMTAEQDQTTPGNRKSNKEEDDGVDGGEGFWWPLV